MNFSLDDEMKALLGAYAAGTLTDAERRRLFEKALGHQELFDQLLDEETMRATLENPLVKRTLRNALERAEGAVPEGQHVALGGALAAPAAARAKREIAAIPIQTQPRRGVWVALVALLCVGTFGVWTLLRPSPRRVELAQVPAPQATVAEPAVVESQAGKVVPQAAPPQRAETEASRRTRATEAAQDRSQPKAQSVELIAAPAPVDAPSSPSRANEGAAAELASGRPAAPPPAPAPAASQLVYALRDEDKKIGAERERRPGENRVALSAKKAAALTPPLRISGGRIEVEAGLAGHLYAFRNEGTRFRKLRSLCPVEVKADGVRSFAIPEDGAGTYYLLLAPQRDAQLDQLPEVQDGALPVRNWTRIAVN